MKQRRKQKHKRDAAKTLSKVKAPNNIQWKLFGKIVEGLADFLPSNDVKDLKTCIRTRNQAKLYTIAEVWSPRSMASDGSSVSSFFARYQVGAFLKKFPFNGDTEQRRRVALEGSRKAEEACRLYNKRGHKALLRADDCDPFLAGSLDLMRDFIAQVLGDKPDMAAVFRGAKHGPGSSLCTKGNRVTQYYKYHDTPYSVTADARDYAVELVKSHPLWWGALEDKYRREFGVPMPLILHPEPFWDWVFEEASGNRMTTVPKDGRKDRPIAIEPRLNVMLQLGVDSVIRRALKRFGCDLDSQEKNQMMAELGSVMQGEGYSTLDLSAASDMIAYILIALLFPPAWVDLFHSLRCHSGTLGDDVVGYHKLSSMGNGFTFAVESLIFLAVCYASVKKHNQRHWHEEQRHYSIRDDVAVFGDDIIVPDEIADQTATLLQLCGFKLNLDKSFTGNSPFRESCGKDFYHGIYVRPIFLDHGVHDVKDCFSIINRLRYTASKSPLGPYWVEGACAVLEKVLSESQKKVIGPLSSTEFDTYLHTPRSLAHQMGGMTGRYENSLWTFQRLLTVGVQQKANSWFFRRLMAEHRPSASVCSSRLSPPLVAKWFRETEEERHRIKLYTPSGLPQESPRTYDVTKRNLLRYKLRKSRVSFWPDSYAECSGY
jgi:hypothetical protein